MIKVRPTLAPLRLPPLISVVPSVRKAYKKRALQTHPDRVPPEQKTIAEEEFRKVRLIRTFTLSCPAHSRHARSTTHTRYLVITVSAG